VIGVNSTKSDERGCRYLKKDESYKKKLPQGAEKKQKEREWHTPPGKPGANTGHYGAKEKRPAPPRVARPVRPGDKKKKTVGKLKSRQGANIQKTGRRTKDLRKKRPMGMGPHGVENDGGQERLELKIEP